MCLKQAYASISDDRIMNFRYNILYISRSKVRKNMEIKEKKSQEIAQNVSIDNLRQNLAFTIGYTHPHAFFF